MPESLTIARRGRRWLPFALFLLGCHSVLAQDALRETFFKDADAARAAAVAANAELLAPRSYSRAAEAYADAEEGLSRGRNIESVRSDATDAANQFKTATETAKLASTTLAQVMKSRQDAANARAPELSPDLWEKAQREFSDAIRLLERGDLKGARNRDAEATGLYREAELVAIKAQYLSETRLLLEDAERVKADRYAPVTYARAQQLLADAERELSENRYDTDLPRSLARQANYEAKHAIHLSDVSLKVRDKELSPEDLVLQWEQALRSVAAAADVLPEMATGPDALTTQLVTYIENIRIENQRLGQENLEDDARLADLEEELRVLDEKLGGATAERAALVERLEAQNRVKEQFEQVEKMFTRDEALVFRQADSIILRLVGLNFDSGAAQIKPQNFELLQKVEKAIDVFPRSELTIEGHTDSYGGDDMNQTLSQQRAESVQQYMINAMRIPTYRLIATGYGETRPIASNETASGRERNRRIDIVIKPELDEA
jgi:outer membrane protein OmpA-like peptidoglycan-associated protein